MTWAPTDERDPRIEARRTVYRCFVSVRHGLPAGAFDLDHVTSDVEIRSADGSEAFTPLGEPDTTTDTRSKPPPRNCASLLTPHPSRRSEHRPLPQGFEIA
ncbi:hypothetical protein [Streptomyces sp. NPDC002526]